MYIKKYWGNYIGGSDDSLNLVDFLEDQKKEEITLDEIFTKIGLDKQNWDFRQTVEYLEFTHSNGAVVDFHFAIDIITDLAAILLECYVNGSVSLHDLDDYNMPNRNIRIVAGAKEHDAMNKALADFADNPLSYDLHELMDDEEVLEMAKDVEEIRKELYETAGENRNYHVKKEEMKDILIDWNEADGCIATSRIMVEGAGIGYCYREEPDGDWDSGWRFTAGDESDDYMDDPNNSGLYKLNTICNYEPKIVSLLNIPAPCAFMRDKDTFKPVEITDLIELNEEELMNQCQIWNENEQYEKIIDALESISEEERTPKMDSELARAYNNFASPNDRELFKKAISLLKPHEEYFFEDHCWNYRMGYAYYYLNQEENALYYFEKALEARPNDKDTIEYIEDCKKRLSLPIFAENFKERTKAAWKAFAKQEIELRQMIDADENNEYGEELVKKCESILNIAFEDISFEIGFNGQKYELILTPEGDKIKLFEFVYFQKHALKEILEHWNILVGRQADKHSGLKIDGIDINGDDVQIWIEQKENESIALSAYCEKLLPLLLEDENKVWWILTTLIDQILGEISHMRYICSFDILESVKDEEAILLSELPEIMKAKGLELVNDANEYLELYTGYEMKPSEEVDADWRFDTIVGSTRCAALINGYLNNDDDFIDELHNDGIAAGFFCYPLDTLKENQKSERIFDFRDELEEMLIKECGEDVLTLVGGATGVNYGYVDFIAWNLKKVLDVAKCFFEEADIPWAAFHSFRRDADTVFLKEIDDVSDEEQIMKDFEYIPYSKENEDEFYEQIEKWNDEDKFTRCIDVLNEVAKKWQDYRFAYALARALENYAILGDDGEGTPKYKGNDALLKAIDVLESVREEGWNKAQWNMRMAYAYQYLFEQEEKAIFYAKRWAELDPEDLDAITVINECEQEINKRKYANKRKRHEFISKDVLFENFELTDFWDDSDYALKEYVSEPPSDEMIASIEEELGYKLPDSYIWLMKQHNGGIPRKTCFPSDEPTSWAEDHVAITGIMGIGRDKDYSLCGNLGSRFMIEEWGYPEIGVAICDCPSAGHDMIFLDYRKCGPLGEPQVVHIDQENDYKITYLADSFEEFIRGLEDEEFFEEDDFDDADGDNEETEKNNKGQFLGFVLMSKGQWDKQQFISDLKEKWDIDVQEDEEDKREDSIVFEIDDMMAAISLMPYPIPNGEAEMNAENNYMWPEAVEAAKEHSAHIMVAVLGQEEDVIKKGKLYVKLIATCCNQKYASGIYTSGTVFEPAFYEHFAEMMKEDELPIYNWIWFGMYRNENGLNAYTYGMDIFGKDEMEILNVNAEPEELRDFLVSIAVYVIGSDVELHDGETIGFSADDIHAITRSEGISIPGMTLKISYEPSEPKNNSEDYEDALVDFTMDDGIYHVESIADKELATDELNAYSHMAIYLRWCMEHDLMSEDFLEEFNELVEQIKTNPESEDLRHFIWSRLDGRLNTVLFNEMGKAFSYYYYGKNDAPYYPNDIDSYAINRIGEERNYSDEIKDEAYLFIPFDEKYYQDIAAIIDRRFINWQGQEFDEDTLEQSELAKAMMEYLDCECTYFPSMKDDDPIMSAYSYAARDGAYEGYVPMLIKVDEILWESLIINSDPDSECEDEYLFDKEKVAQYRKEMLSADLENGRDLLYELVVQRKEEDWEETLGMMRGGYDNCRFASYWNGETHMTYPLILAKIPVKNPWEVFAYLPFGNWNECPDTQKLMAVAKYWFERYKAVPSVITHDELEFLLPEPVIKEEAMELAIEQYGFCPDIVDQEQDDPTIGSLADVLWQSTVWYFWWD